MRSDYALYMVAIILFIITGIALLYQTEQLWIVATTVLGLVFIGLGYFLRPKPKAPTIEARPSPPAPPTPTTPAVTEIVQEVKTEAVAEAAPLKVELTEVKGIGEKRAQQLKDVGIGSVEDLAKASVNDLATRMKISPKITGKWIEDAKRLLEKS